MKRIQKYLLSFLTISIILLVIASYYFSSLVLYPKVKCNAEHHVYCNGPAELGLEFQEVEIKTQDKLNLVSYWIPAKNAKATILLVHGHGGQRNEGLRFAKSLNAAGYNLLLLSLRRNHGGFASMGFHEQKDIEAALSYLKTNGYNKIGIFGFSMGSATSIIAMADHPEIQAGIFSSGYGSAIDVLVESAKRDFGIPYYPLIPVVKLALNLRGDMDIDSVRPIDKIASISPRPIAIFHCKMDDYVDYHHALDLFAKAGEPKSLWSPECHRHERLWNFAPKEAESQAVGFFQKYLR
ncbi:alpha/beta hydrolase [Leptospira sp. 2 VSF19]|uniref:Alpha/beta hydrolase n=1 Tax=Leptospira soteropolitanensis TaxID=2950025 RepID=A0AAW5VBB9_9LEPT|nr:alpha/beta hydrolase [Leptospira soteropolitanensis]MCW7492000.1 alpha/beta hydrolase [Leptospira soteropolitanensis]MCW7499582.1 alpha/beta hydrolase [Leptospira soteropolitanensis]MCW7521833.1 alpha/beta hydrolase [Leptospira soteropolitanensis]MCW7525687.1 alpha/beta hydrolase [Leptospira soteropolitanensis]MCW7530199.1 alpha/beta hydrolase [Leptospira soteropolitanensis]